ncbi:hypothetical protein FJ250_11870 [bacterium]|nr:hypothetical protein [bacterium]
MNRRFLTMAALVLLVGAFVAAEADAAGSGKGEKRTEMPADYMRPNHFDRDPSMSFLSGTLRRDGLSGWRAGDMTVQLAPNAVVLGPDGEESVLQEGREALIMGPRFGGTILAWSVRMLSPDSGLSASTAGEVTKPSDVDPHVGELISAPY